MSVAACKIPEVGPLVAGNAGAFQPLCFDSSFSRTIAALSATNVLPFVRRHVPWPWRATTLCVMQE